MGWGSYETAYGDGNLRVTPKTGGVFLAPDALVNEQGEIWDKFLFWGPGNSDTPLRVTGHRLDAEAPPLRADSNDSGADAVLVRRVLGDYRYERWGDIDDACRDLAALTFIQHMLACGMTGELGEVWQHREVVWPASLRVGFGRVRRPKPSKSESDPTGLWPLNDGQFVT